MTYIDFFPLLGYKACGIDGFPNECLRNLARRHFERLTHLINHCLWLSHFPTPWKDSKFRTLPKPGTDSKCPQNLRAPEVYDFRTVTH
jgi:hypothetical protein